MFGKDARIEHLHDIISKQNARIEKLEQENDNLYQRLTAEKERTASFSENVREMIQEIEEKKKALELEYGKIQDLKDEYTLIVAEIKRLKEDAQKEYSSTVKDLIKKSKK